MASEWLLDYPALHSDYSVFDGKYGEKKAYICLGEVIGDTRHEYVLTIDLNELMKIGYNSY